MNISGIGTDIVAIPRIQAIWERFGGSFAKRILTSEELEELKKSTAPVSFLAKRFAAKEALVKALGTGFREGILLTEIGVTKDRLGRPHLTFTGRTQTEIEARFIKASHLSLSDEKEYALAFVILVSGQKNTPVEVTGAKN